MSIFCHILEMNSKLPEKLLSHKIILSACCQYWSWIQSFLKTLSHKIILSAFCHVLEMNSKLPEKLYLIRLCWVHFVRYWRWTQSFLKFFISLDYIEYILSCTGVELKSCRKTLYHKIILSAFCHVQELNSKVPGSWKTLSHKIILSAFCHVLELNSKLPEKLSLIRFEVELIYFLVDGIGSCKSKYNMITINHKSALRLNVFLFNVQEIKTVNVE